MNITYACRQMVQVLHAEIRRLGPDGEIIEAYGNLPGEFDPFRRDQVFLQKVLNRKPKGIPDLFCEKGYIYYGLLGLENGEIFLAGPVRITTDNEGLCEYMIAQHHLQGDGSYKIPYCNLGTFSSGMLLLFHLLTGKEPDYRDFLEENREDTEIERKSGVSINGRVFHHRKRKPRIIPMTMNCGSWKPFRMETEKNWKNAGMRYGWANTEKWRRILCGRLKILP